MAGFFRKAGTAKAGGRDTRDLRQTVALAPKAGWEPGIGHRCLDRDLDSLPQVGRHVEILTFKEIPVGLDEMTPALVLVE